MSSFTEYNSSGVYILTPEPVAGEAGQVLNDNFKSLVDTDADLASDIALLAPKANPTFTGVASAPKFDAPIFVTSDTVLTLATDDYDPSGLSFVMDSGSGNITCVGNMYVIGFFDVSSVQGVYVHGGNSTGLTASEYHLMQMDGILFNAGVNYELILLDVSDISSGSGTKLMTLKVDGVEKFGVNKSGAVSAVALSASRTVTAGVVALTDGATINTNASLGNEFTVTLGGNRTMAAPTNPTSGQKIIYRIKQDSTGNRSINWNGGVGGFRFPSGVAPTLTSTGGKTDYLGFSYNASDNKWDLLAERMGFG